MPAHTHVFGVLFWCWHCLLPAVVVSAAWAIQVGDMHKGVRLLAGLQEEGKTMARYLEGFSSATQRAQGAPNLTLIADVSLSTLTYYIAQGAKAHR